MWYDWRCWSCCRHQHQHQQNESSFSYIINLNSPREAYAFQISHNLIRAHTKQHKGFMSAGRLRRCPNKESSWSLNNSIWKRVSCKHNILFCSRGFALQGLWCWEESPLITATALPQRGILKMLEQRTENFPRQFLFLRTFTSEFAPSSSRTEGFLLATRYLLTQAYLQITFCSYFAISLHNNLKLF